VIFHHVEAFVLDLPARPAAGDDFGDILFRDGKARDPSAMAFDASGSPYIRWNRETLDRSGGDIQGSPSMSLLTTSIESTGLTRWNFGLGALTLLGVFAIALALALPDSFTP
jgi:hypothetical protein